MNKWEIGGISAAPIIEAIMALELHSKVGMSTEQFIHVIVALFTLAAIVRALMDKKAKAALPAAPSE